MAPRNAGCSTPPSVRRARRCRVRGAVTLDALHRSGPDVGREHGIGLLAGAYAVLKALGAKQIGANDSASVLPEHLDPPQP